jgi:CRP-like cAMP-binding protein
MRLEAQRAELANQEEQRSDAKGYGALQNEVREAWQAQEEADLDEAELERDLRDTLRDSAGHMRAGVLSAPGAPFPLFSDLDTKAFLSMVNKMERRVVPGGSLVFQEGDPGDSLFLVSSGNLLVMKSNERGRQVELARLGPGSFFGEFALLTDRRRHASVRALDECELLSLQRTDLMELIEEHPSVAWTLRVFYQQRLMAMVIATSPLFQAVPNPDRRAVLSRFAHRRILEGEVVIEQGKPGTGFFVILVGEVSVTCTDKDGQEVPLGSLSEGDYFGEISLLTGSFAEATVRANQITEVLTLNARDFYDLASQHPEIWAEVQEEAERRQQDTADRLAKRIKAAGPACLL